MSVIAKKKEVRVGIQNTNSRPLLNSLLGKDRKMWAQVAEAHVHPS